MKALGPYAVKIHILLLTLVVSIPQVLAAPAPIEVVETGTQKVLQALEKHQTNTEVRRQAIPKIVDEYFNFDDMDKRSIGPVWNGQPPVSKGNSLSHSVNFCLMFTSTKLKNIRVKKSPPTRSK